MNSKYLNVNRLWVSMLVLFPLAVIFPGQQVSDSQMIFGFPFVWFTLSNDANGKWLFNSMSIGIFQYLADVAICYFIILVFSQLYERFKVKK